MARHIEDDRTKKVELMRIALRNEKIRRMNECGNCATIYSRVSLDSYLIFYCLVYVFSVKSFD
jgi:hypothetical protein